jgi:formyltetrahydrofolate deformylase
VDLPGLRAAFASVADAEQLEWRMHDGAQRAKVLILVSKLDHCLEDLLYRRRIGELNMEITGIVSNHQTMHTLAERHSIPFHHLPITPETKAQQESRLLELVRMTESELVVLARYMQILSDETARRLPGFKGAKPYHQAHSRGVKLIGATAHYVTGDLDEGPIIEQIVERVDHSFTPEMLVAAGRDSERRALSTAVRLILEHRVFMAEGKTVVFK